MDAEGIASGRDHAPGQSSHDLEPLRRDVHQPQFTEWEALDPVQETADQFRRVAGAAANDGYF